MKINLFFQDGNGYLTADELKEVFNPGNHTEVDEKVWKDLIHEVDQNGDDKVINELKGIVNEVFLDII